MSDIDFDCPVCNPDFTRYDSLAVPCGKHRELIAAERTLDAACTDMANAIRNQQSLEGLLELARGEVAYRTRLKEAAGDALRAARKRMLEAARRD